MPLSLVSTKPWELQSSLQMILSGERNLTIAHIHKVARAFKMASAEHGYFETLVHFEQSTDDLAKSYYRSRLQTLKKEAKIFHQRTSDRRVISDTLMPALLIYLSDIEGVGGRKTIDQIDAEDLAKRFAVNVTKIRTCLQQFKESGLFERQQEHKRHLIFQEVAGKTSEKEYFLAEVKALNQKAQHSFSDTENFFRTFTFSMNKSELPSLRNDLFNLLERYMSRTLDNSEAMVIEKVIVGAYTAAGK